MAEGSLETNPKNHRTTRLPSGRSYQPREIHRLAFLLHDLHPLEKIIIFAARLGPLFMVEASAIPLPPESTAADGDVAQVTHTHHVRRISNPRALA